MSYCFKALSLGVLSYTATENQTSHTHKIHAFIASYICVPCWKLWVHPYLQFQFSTTLLNSRIHSSFFFPFTDSKDLTLIILNILTYWITPTPITSFLSLPPLPHAGLPVWTLTPQVKAMGIAYHVWTTILSRSTKLLLVFKKGGRKIIKEGRRQERISNLIPKRDKKDREISLK